MAMRLMDVPKYLQETLTVTNAKKAMEVRGGKTSTRKKGGRGTAHMEDATAIKECIRYTRSACAVRAVTTAAAADAFLVICSCSRVPLIVPLRHTHKQRTRRLTASSTSTRRAPSRSITLWATASLPRTACHGECTRNTSPISH